MSDTGESKVNEEFQPCPICGGPIRQGAAGRDTLRCTDCDVTFWMNRADRSFATAAAEGKLARVARALEEQQNRLEEIRNKVRYGDMTPEQGLREAGIEE